MEASSLDLCPSTHVPKLLSLKRILNPCPPCRYVRQFFRRLLACGVTPIVVFDGGWGQHPPKTHHPPSTNNQTPPTAHHTPPTNHHHPPTTRLASPTHTHTHHRPSTCSMSFSWPGWTSPARSWPRCSTGSPSRPPTPWPATRSTRCRQPRQPHGHLKPGHYHHKYKKRPKFLCNIS